MPNGSWRWRPKSGSATDGVVIHIDRACEIETDWLLERFTDRIEDKEVCEWNDKAERVDAFQAACISGNWSSKKKRVAGDPEKVAEVLFAAAKARGIEAFAPGEALAELKARVAFVQAANRSRKSAARAVLRAGVPSPS